MNWLCWHVGSCVDPKFKIIAKKTGASLSQVLHAWAYHLERAAQSAPRGHYGEIDPEEAELDTEIPPPLWMALTIAFEDRDLTRQGAIVNFDKRNYGNSTLRVKAFRERQRRLAFSETLQVTHETLQVTAERSCNATGQDRQNKEHKNGADAPPPSLKAILFGRCLTWLAHGNGADPTEYRSMIGRWIRDHGEEKTLTAFSDAERCDPQGSRVAYMQTLLKPKPKRRTEQMPL